MDVQDFVPGEEVVAGIRADIERYEAERREVQRAVWWRVPVFLGGVIAVVAVVALLFNLLADPFEQWTSAPHLSLYIGGIAALFFAYRQAVAPARRLRHSFRERVLPSAFVFVHQFRYRNGERPYTFDQLPKEVTASYTTQNFGDVISGTYDDFGFELYEVTLRRSGRKNSIQVFKGVVLAFGAVVPFPGVLVATPRGATLFGFVRKMFGGKPSGLQSGVDVVDATYRITTDNVKAARPLVSGRLAQALQWLIEGWPGRPARVALRGDSGFLLIAQETDFFALPPVSRSLDYQRHIAPMIVNLGALLATAALVRKVNVPDEKTQHEEAETYRDPAAG